MKKNLVILVITLLTLNVSCTVRPKLALMPTNNDGGYLLEMINSKGKPTNISGTIYDKITGLPLSHSVVTMGCLKVKTTESGEYTFSANGPLSVKVFLSAISVGYLEVETRMFDFKTEAIKCDFFLVEDRRPLIECVEIGGLSN